MLSCAWLFEPEELTGLITIGDASVHGVKTPAILLMILLQVLKRSLTHRVVELERSVLFLSIAAGQESEK